MKARIAAVAIVVVFAAGIVLTGAKNHVPIPTAAASPGPSATP